MGCGGDRCSGLLLMQVSPLRTDVAARKASSADRTVEIFLRMGYHGMISCTEGV